MSSEPDEPSRGWTRTSTYALVLLTLVSTLNYFDRSVLSLMLPLIKKDFQVSDVNREYNESKRAEAQEARDARATRAAERAAAKAAAWEAASPTPSSSVGSNGRMGPLIEPLRHRGGCAAGPGHDAGGS